MMLGMDGQQRCSRIVVIAFAQWWWPRYVGAASRRVWRAVVYSQYGLPDVLSLKDVARPVAGAGEVLVRVVAVSVNPGDWDVMRGVPYVLRASTGLRRPKAAVLGIAVAGRVEAVGEGVADFDVGDEVYAEVPRGGFAEFVCAAESEAARMPTGLTFEEAAAVPVAGVTALQGLRDAGQVVQGQSVLVNGASGGVGTFAVQIAKALGAEVTGVCSARNVQLVRGLGADHVVDYATEDFTRLGMYDLVFDNVGNRSLGEMRRAVKPGGVLIPNSNKGDARWLGNYLRRAIRSIVTSPFVSQKLKPFAAHSSREDLETLAAMIEADSVDPEVDRTFDLAETSEALSYYGTGHATGRVIIKVNTEDG